jgi:hypothetical protein
MTQMPPAFGQPQPTVDPSLPLSVSPLRGSPPGWPHSGHRPIAPEPTGHAAISPGVVSPGVGDLVIRGEQCVAELQERLRLGVRMLQAFDVQIQRSELANGQVTQQLAHQLNTVAQQSELRVRGAIDILDRRLAESVPFLDERLQQAHEQVARLVEDRLSSAERRIEERHGPVRDELRRFADELTAGFAARLDELLRERIAAAAATLPSPRPAVDPAALDALDRRVGDLLANAERRIAALESGLAAAEVRAARIAVESSEATDALLGTIGTASSLKDLIAEDVRESRRVAEEVKQSTREMDRDLNDVVDRCGNARASATEALRTFEQASRTLEARTAAIDALRIGLDGLEARLAPWEPLARQGGEPLRNLVDSASNAVRQSLADDMRAFSQALKSLATRADSAFTAARFDEFSAAREQSFGEISPLAAATVPGTGAAEAADQPSAALPIETRRLTAEILALDASSLLRRAQSA